MVNIKKKLREMNPALYASLWKKYKKITTVLGPAHIKRMRHYRKFVAPAEQKKLQECGFAELRCFSPTAWRFGAGLDHAFRRYYTAKYLGQKVFIKVAKDDATICNEIDTGSRLQGHTVLTGGQLLLSDKAFGSRTMMMAVPYVPDLQEMKLPVDRQAFENLCREFIKILDALQEVGVVHADIHKGNLMGKNDGTLVLLDYGISMIPGQKNTVDYKARPGTFYQEKTENGVSVRVYDDAYSFVKMMEKFGLSQEWENCPVYQQIKARIGRFEGVVEL